MISIAARGRSPTAPEAVGPDAAVDSDCAADCAASAALAPEGPDDRAAEPSEVQAAIVASRTTATPQAIRAVVRLFDRSGAGHGRLQVGNRAFRTARSSVMESAGASWRCSFSPTDPIQVQVAGLSRPRTPQAAARRKAGRSASTPASRTGRCWCWPTTTLRCGIGRDRTRAAPDDPASASASPPGCTSVGRVQPHRPRRRAEPPGGRCRPALLDDVAQLTGGLRSDGAVMTVSALEVVAGPRSIHLLVTCLGHPPSRERVDSDSWLGGSGPAALAGSRDGPVSGTGRNAGLAARKSQPGFCAQAR